MSQPNGLVLLTNQFLPNTLTGIISAIGIDTSTNLAGVNGEIFGLMDGDITIDNASLRSYVSVLLMLEMVERYLSLLVMGLSHLLTQT